MKMPEMPPLEAAEIILNPRGHGTSERNAAECMAASYLRAIAAGEYKRVVYCDDCALLDRSPCPARDPETGKTRNCVGYCRVGALMDGKDDDL